VKEEKLDTGCQTVPGRDAPPFLVIRRHKNLGKNTSLLRAQRVFKKSKSLLPDDFQISKKGSFPDY